MTVVGREVWSASHGLSPPSAGNLRNSPRTSLGVRRFLHPQASQRSVDVITAAAIDSQWLGWAVATGPDAGFSFSRRPVHPFRYQAGAFRATLLGAGQ
jgi:hypothetical protein